MNKAQLEKALRDEQRKNERLEKQLQSSGSRNLSLREQLKESKEAHEQELQTRCGFQRTVNMLAEQLDTQQTPLRHLADVTDKVEAAETVKRNLLQSLDKVNTRLSELQAERNGVLVQLQQAPVLPRPEIHQAREEP